MLTLPAYRHCITEQPKFWLQDLFDANQLQSQLDEQASMFINRQVQMLPCPCACMHAFSTVTDYMPCHAGCTYKGLYYHHA